MAKKAKSKSSVLKLLGSGLAKKAGVTLKGRKAKLDAKIKASGG